MSRKLFVQRGTILEWASAMAKSTLTSFTVLSSLALTVLACGSSGDEFVPRPPFEALDDVKVWATTASAVAVYSNVHQDIAVFQGKQRYADSACPVVNNDAATWTAQGGCTDAEGKNWKGQLRIERDGDDFALSYTGFDEREGTFSVRRLEPELHEFEARLVIGGFTTIKYQGTVQGSYERRTLWNGAGTVERNGFLPPSGTIEAATLAEVVDDDACAGQPVSGKTTLTSGGDVAVITYDGETDCDDAKNAELTVNGQPRGPIGGISCSVGAPGATNECGWSALACVLGVAAARASRNRRRPRA